MGSPLGFVGLGDMGLPMVHRLVRAGHDVAVHDVRAEAVADAVQAGATAAGSARNAAAGSEIVFTCLPTERAVRAVVLDPETGLAAGMAPGSILVETSTVPVEFAREIADGLGRRGVAVLDAPFLPASIEDGAVTFLVGGAEATLERAREALSGIGDRIVHLGPHGAGAAAKMAIQYAGICNLVAAAEAAFLARALGVDLERLVDLVSGTTADSAVFGVAADGVRRGARDVPEGGKLGILAKDIDMCVQAAREAGTSHGMADASDAVFSEALRRGWADRSFHAVFALLEHPGSPGKN
ncbi:NAD(P)-dependent oxidoreductase [Amycolatopsis jejuensis]|uniref:NAD(P)-dependent oxidoreductase n=1 Tax=Amycolatopsis jejuensis TaxID=330084 RepID=UPI00068CDF28|nr:NAD(P)-dependent oxidoreductase [Amycolatopsis jejuensis]